MTVRLGLATYGICAGGFLLLQGCGSVCGDDGFAWQQKDNPACQLVTDSNSNTDSNTESATETATDSQPTEASQTNTETLSEPTDSGSGGEWCRDADGDGFGDPMECMPEMFPGSVPNDGDCADDNEHAFPGSAEKDSETACMEDVDDDGYGDDMPPPGVEPGTDCNDDNGTIFPGAAEKDDPLACNQDSDGDGHGDSMPDDPDVPPGSDCADDDPFTFPGSAPNDSETACMTDADDDDWGDDMPTLPQAEPGTDCDDANPNAHPGAAENEVDPSLCQQDDDDDGYGDSMPDDPGTVPGTDCKDDDASTFPGSAPNDDPTACMTDADDDDYGDLFPEEGVEPGTDCDDADAGEHVDCVGCNPGEVQCIGDELHACNDRGNAEEVTPCEFGCDDDGKACWEGLTVDAGPSLCIDPGDPAQLSAVAMGGDGAYVYDWTPPNGLDDPSIANPLAMPNGLTEYTVSVSDGEGNMASDSVSVFLKDQALNLDPDDCTVYDFPHENNPENNDPVANWAWDPQDSELCQTLNAKASALFCGWELNDATISGTFSVNTATDDDWPGFMWGIQDTSHFYVFTWKQMGQVATTCGNIDVPSGMQVKVVDVQDPMNEPLTCMDIHAPNDTANSRLLVSAADFSTMGWADNVAYTFELTHTAGGDHTIRIRRANNNMLVAETTFNDATFPGGAFGMYTKSQQNACFSNFTVSCL